MTSKKKSQLVYTVKEKCRRCYTCVRECPAKAIKIVNGQAEIISERCIGCGNCVVVCSQNAKQYRSSIDEVFALLNSKNDTIAIVAPSFPAEFQEISDYKLFIGMLRSVGFDRVAEVAFGADLVARKYLELMENEERYYITTSCPAVVSYIQKYQPELVKHMIPVVSPMVAMAEVIRKKYGSKVNIIFIGPCIAKKSEAEQFNGCIDAVLTFTELREIFNKYNINSKNVETSDFDSPVGGKGALFPISRGMIQSIDLDKNPIVDDIIVAEGRVDFPEALREFRSGLLNNHHLDLLCCNGCIMGAGMSNGGKRYVRREYIKKYFKEKKKNFDYIKWKEDIKTYLSLDLSRDYQKDDQRISLPPTKEDINEVLKRMGKTKPEDELNCGACGYDTCREHAEAILTGLAESEMCLPYTIEKLHESIIELENTEKALKQTEKLASMGQLSAGIAHEVNNPLGIVLLYSHILMEKLNESSEIFDDIKMIANHADRCKNIISGLLNFARKNEVQLKNVDLIQIIKKSIKNVVVPETITVNIINNLDNETAYMDPDQIIQVFTNLIKNAVDALNNEGIITIITEGNIKEVSISIKDNGPGIPKEHLEKLFEPFYTTKTIGKGTGLGLSVSYGIVKMHKGRISVDSNTEITKGKTGTTFTVVLPRNRK